MSSEITQISEEIINPGHGTSPAAWVANITVLIAFIVGALFFESGNGTGILIATVIAAVGVIAGIVLAKLGYGVRGPKYHAKGH